MTEETKPKSRRGFAGMDKEKGREIARRGGAGVAATDRSFYKDRALAASAGRRGGQAGKGKPKNFYPTKVVTKEDE